MSDFEGLLDAYRDILKKQAATSYEDLGIWPLREYVDAARAALEKCYDELAKERDGESCVLYMTVARLGGLVEGMPTARLNFLQRIDELRTIEKRCAKLQAALDQDDKTKTSKE